MRSFLWMGSCPTKLAGTVCCTVFPCVAVSFGVLQCVSVCCTVFPCVAVSFGVLQCVSVCCSVFRCVLQCVLVCVAPCFSVWLVFFSVCCSLFQCDSVCFSVMHVDLRPSKVAGTVCCSEVQRVLQRVLQCIVVCGMSLFNMCHL